MQKPPLFPANGFYTSDIKLGVKQTVIYVRRRAFASTLSSHKTELPGRREQLGRMRTAAFRLTAESCTGNDPLQKKRIAAGV